MSLSDMLQQAATQDSLEIPAGWGQGRATYGGLVAAVLLARVQAVAGGNARALANGFLYRACGSGAGSAQCRSIAPWQIGHSAGG